MKLRQRTLRTPTSTLTLTLIRNRSVVVPAPVNLPIQKTTDCMAIPQQHALPSCKQRTKSLPDPLRPPLIAEACLCDPVPPSIPPAPSSETPAQLKTITPITIRQGRLRRSWERTLKKSLSSHLQRTTTTMAMSTMPTSLFFLMTTAIVTSMDMATHMVL